MLIVGVVSGICCFVQKYSFGTLGGTVTYKIRELLYMNILQKNIGWFDNRDNGPSVLTSTMAEDTSVINGVGGESMGPAAEAAFGMIIGIAIGFWFCWQQAIVCLLVSPILMIGGALEMETMKAETEDTGEMAKEANLLCGDSIVNFKTVQSFGHEDKLVEKYEEMMSHIHKNNMCKVFKSGLFYGIGQIA